MPIDEISRIELSDLNIIMTKKAKQPKKTPKKNPIYGVQNQEGGVTRLKKVVAVKNPPPKARKK